MSLSISNQEIKTLASCNMSSEIIAVDLKGEGRPQIVKLSRDDVTCWQLFLKFFGCGNLASKEVYLSDVTRHLNAFDWKALGNAAPSSDQYQAYSRVCDLANKALLRNHVDLYHNVALATVDKRVDFTQMQGGFVLNNHEAIRSIHWNPALQVKHIVADLRGFFHTENIRIQDHNGQDYSAERRIGREDLAAMKITATQHLPVPVRAPAPAHVAVGSRNRLATPQSHVRTHHVSVRV